MSNKTKILRSSVPGRVPSIAQLGAGELGMNMADGILYFGTGDRVIPIRENLSDLAAAQARRSTTLALTTTDTNVSFDLTDYANSGTIVHDNADRTRIVIYEAGVYLISIDGESINTNNTNSDIFSIKVNGTVVPGAFATITPRSARVGFSRNKVISLNAGDYVQVSARSSAGTSGTMQIGATVSVVRLQGSVGPAGAPGGLATYLYNAATFDNPVNANWAVNSLAPVSVDTTNTSLLVRAFDDTVNEGLGFNNYVPPASSNVSFEFTFKCATAPASARAVLMSLYSRQLAVNGPMPAWSAAFALATLNIPTNVYYQKQVVSIPLATLGLAAGNHYQFELVRNSVSASDNLVGDFHLLNLLISFS